jgi:hypothetical protein
VRTSAARRLRLAAWLSVASLAAVVPHAIEDATLGVPQRFGLSPVAAGWLFGLFVAAQIAAAVAALEGRRWAPPAMVVIGAVWAAGALIDHAGAFQTGSFRAGLSSRVWVWSIVGLQSAVAFVAGSVATSRRL